MLKFSQTPKEEYIVFKEDLFTKHPQMLIVPQNHPSSLYVSTKQELPMVTKLFVGGLSMVGLYVVYRFLDAKR